MELSPVYPIREEYYNQSIEEIRDDVEPVPANQILKGVVAYVEVRSNAENRSQAISIELQQLGAIVSNRLNGAVTHVVYREGRKRTKDWASRHAIPLVSVGWIQACKRKKRRISEADFDLMNIESDSDEASPIAGIPAKRRLRSMQPKDFDEELKLSAERKKRATRRNAKRNALHQRAIQAEKNLQSLESDTVRNYYANPCIRVPRTPPSMKEFTERLERKKDGCDTESPSTRSSVSSKMPRRRLFSSSSCQEPSTMAFTFCEAKDGENSMVSPRKSTSACMLDQQATDDNFHNRTCEIQSYDSPMRSDTSFRQGRKLFNATAFEASGVIIEPQYSSNRLQDISKVFPKSFRKRNIFLSSKMQKSKRKRLPPVEQHDSDSELGDTCDDLKYSTSVKSRRLSCDSFIDSGIRATISRDIPRASPLVCDSPKDDADRCLLNEYEEAAKGETVSSSHTDESPQGSPQSSSQSKVVLSKLSELRRKSRKTVSDVLEVIDKEDTFRNFIKKPPFGCSSFVRRKSVRFSDKREDSPVFGDSRHCGTTGENRSTSSINPFHDETADRATPSSLIRRKSSVNSSDVQNNTESSFVFKSDRKKLDTSIEDFDTDAESINMESLVDAIRIVSQSADLDEISTPNHMSPKRRRSSRLINRHSSSADNSSSIKETSVSIMKQYSRPKDKHFISRRSTPGSSSRSSVVGVQQRLRYSYESDSCCPKSDEEVYGVLLMEKPSNPRKLKRISVESVVKAITASPSSSQSERNSPFTKTRHARPSIDDFKLSNISQKSGSSQSNHSLSRLKQSTESKSSSDRISRRKLIVFTSLHKGEQESGRKAVMSLGNGRINENVTTTTTHVVTNWPIRRTLNLLRGVVFGCHIVTLSWLTDSREAGFWLPEDQYRINEVPTPKENPSIRKLFQSFKGIYVENGVSPPQKELKALIQLAGGKVESSIAQTPQSASIIVSSQSGGSTCVSPKWILDSIMETETLPLHEYQST